TRQLNGSQLACCTRSRRFDYLGKVKTVGVNLVVAHVAKNEQIFCLVGTSVGVSLNMVKFQRSWVLSCPFFPIPSTGTASVFVTGIHRLLHFLWNMAVVWFCNAVNAFKDIFARTQVWPTSEPSRHKITFFRSQFSGAAAK